LDPPRECFAAARFGRRLARSRHGAPAPCAAGVSKDPGVRPEKAALRPRVGAAQPLVPVVGLLQSGSFEQLRLTAAALRESLGEAGFVEGRNIRIEYRWAGRNYGRLPALAAELLRIPVAVLAATGITAALAAQKATATVPAVFHTGGDPVEAGLVPSLNRPGSNVTGIVTLGKLLVPKHFELLHELVPEAAAIGFLVNPKNGVLQSDISNAREAAQTKGGQLRIVEAGNDGEIDTAFAALGQRHIGGLIVQPDQFLDGRHQQIAALAARYSIPAIAAYPQFAAAGGLVSYGNSLAAGIAWRKIMSPGS
jgi:putative ABC transport system substrate-binding protein